MSNCCTLYKHDRNAATSDLKNPNKVSQTLTVSKSTLDTHKSLKLENPGFQRTVQICKNQWYNLPCTLRMRWGVGEKSYVSNTSINQCYRIHRGSRFWIPFPWIPDYDPLDSVFPSFIFLILQGKPKSFDFSFGFSKALCSLFNPF